MVIGDVMLDEYVFGKVDRISPEAPVPIVTVSNREYRLGGAANVALNLKNLGVDVILCGITGTDEESKLLKKQLKKEKLSEEGLFSIKNRKTTIKTRVVSNNQQMIRIDHEDIGDLTKKETDSWSAAILQLLAKHKPQGVIFEDYDKGCLNQTIIEKVVAYCNSKNIFTAVDPKKKNFLFYKKVSLFKPNLKEITEGLKTDIDPSNLKELEVASEKLMKLIDAKSILLTLSKHGIFYKDQKQKGKVIPAQIRKINDVSGAGDTVISVATICKCLGLSSSFSASLANLAGGLVCEYPGVVPIEKRILLAEAKKTL